MKTEYNSLRVSTYKKKAIKKRREAVKIELIKKNKENKIKREEEIKKEEGIKKEEVIKKEDGIKKEYIKKEEAKILPFRPIYNFNMNIQRNFAPCNQQPYHPTAQQSQEAMRNSQILNMHYAYSYLSMLSANRMTPFHFNFSWF